MQDEAKTSVGQSDGQPEQDDGDSCDDESDDTPPPSEATLDAVRRLHGRKECHLRFISNEPNPYDEDGERTMDIYRDADGFEYWFDTVGGTLLQAGLSEDSDPPPQQIGQEARLSVGELRERAVATAERMIPGFAKTLSSLHPLEANDRKTIYFFRWEDLSEPLSETELPPFVQIGLRADGGLAGYTDTLSLKMAVIPSEGASGCTYPPQSWTKAER